MKFITMRELRNQTQVIEGLGPETGVVTPNGKPVGILLQVEDDFGIALGRSSRGGLTTAQVGTGVWSQPTDEL